MMVMKMFNRKNIIAEYDDSMRTDAEKIVKVFDSCNTAGQYDIAWKMLDLFETKHNIIYLNSSAVEDFYKSMINDAAERASKRVFMPY